MNYLPIPGKKNQLMHGSKEAWQNTSERRTKAKPLPLFTQSLSEPNESLPLMEAPEAPLNPCMYSSIAN